MRTSAAFASIDSKRYALAVVLKDYGNMRENCSESGRELFKLELVFVIWIRAGLFS